MHLHKLAIGMTVGFILRGYPRTPVGERQELLESWRTFQKKGVREHGADRTTAAAISIVAPLLPPPRTQHGGTPRRVDMRAVLDTLLYQNRTGCQGERLPQDL